MKRFCRAFALLVLSLLLVLCLASCGGKEAEVELAIKDGSVTNTVFVLGNDVKLQGILVVTEGEEAYEVSLSDEGVTVTGYDNTVLGEQTVTVTYLDKSVELTVTFVERMQAVDFTADYLVGDTLDLKNGRLKIYGDDGKPFTVALSSTKVKLEGFSSESAGQSVVTAKYEQSGATYTTTFTVTVHPVEEVKLTSPSKAAYKSHETEVSVLGGELVFLGKGGELKRAVKVTEDMIVGFAEALAAADRENPTCSANVYVRYDGVDYPYEIKVTYTNVSDFRDVASALSDIDFSAWDELTDEDWLPEVEDSLGAELVRVMRIYLDMSAAEKALIDDTVALKAARAAMAWAFNAWYEDLGNFSDAFGIANSSIEICAQSAKAVADAAEALSVRDRALYAHTDVIKGLTEAFADKKVCGNLKFKDFPVINNSDFYSLCDMFTYMAELGALMNNIPDGWEDMEAAQLAESVEAVFDKIVDSAYYSYNYAELYRSVSEWSECGGVFDCLYTYYYGNGDLDSLVKLSNVRLPKNLEQIFSYLQMSLSCAQNISYYGGHTTDIFYGYYMAEQLSLLLLLSGDSMQKELFYVIPLNAMLGIGNSDEVSEYTFYNILEYLRTLQGGTNYYSAGLLGVEEYHRFMDQYMMILSKWLSVDEYMTSAEAGTDIEELMRLYMELDSSQQASLAVTLNIYYGTEYGAPFVFNATGDYEGFETPFVTLLNTYYKGLFTSNSGKDAYTALMLAAEAFSQKYSNSQWRTVFDTNMAKVAALLDAMPDEDADIFEERLGYILDKYTALGGKMTDNEDITDLDGLDLQGWEAKLEELHTALLFAELGRQYTAGGVRYYNIFFAAYERAEKISADILKNAPEQIVDLFRYAGLFSAKEYAQYFGLVYDADAEAEYVSYEFFLSILRSHYMNSINVSIVGSSIYDDYISEGGLKAFIEKSYDLIVPFLIEALVDNDGVVDYDAEKVRDALAAFGELDVYYQLVFINYMDDAQQGVFAQAVASFALSEFTEKAGELVYDLYNMEISQMLYDYYFNVGTTSEEDLALVRQNFSQRLDALKAAYTALQGEDATSFAPLLSLYEQIVERAEDALAEAEEA